MVTKRENLNLEVLKKNILSSGNEFSLLYSNLYKRPEKDVLPIKVAYSLSNGITCILRDHEVTFYRVFEGFGS